MTGLWLIAAGVAVSATAGCVTPVVVGPRACAAGLYVVSWERPGPHTTFDRIEGVGIAFRDGDFACGYQRWASVRASVDGDYVANTPLARLAVGRAAEGPEGMSIVLPGPSEKENYEHAK